MSKVNAEQAVKKAQQIIAQGSFRQASQITEQLAKAFPKNASILQMHSMTLFRRGLFSQTIEVLNKVKALLSTDDDQYTSNAVAIAQSQTMLGDRDAAVQTLINAQENTKLGSTNQLLAAELIERYIDLNEPKKAAQILATFEISNQLPVDTTPVLACAWARAMSSSLPVETIITELSKIADGSSNSSSLFFTLGRLLEKAELYDEAFKRYQQANAFNPPAYQREHATNRTRQISKNFTAGKLNSTARPKQDHKLPRPIMIVGMPRSGTTLLEQILAAHPQIAAAGESQALPEIARSLKQHPSGSIAENLQDIYLNELRAAAQGSNSATFITDKNPMNLFLIGLIHAITPDAIIIHINRDPRDVCFSCFSSPLANDHSYKFDLANCAHFLTTAHQTLNHFKPIIQSDPRTTWIDLSYEQLAQDPQPTIKNLFAALGLEPHPDCFNFHQSSRSTQTISKDQVRQAMHTKSIARWGKFAHQPEIEEMISTLRAEGLID